MEEYTAIHEKLTRLYAEASERNKGLLEGWLTSIEYAKEHEGYVENVKLLRGMKRYMEAYEEAICGDNIFEMNTADMLYDNRDSYL